jgi:hypothetical protein
VRLRAQRGEASLSLRLRDVDASPVHLCVGEDEASLSARAEMPASGTTLSSSAGTLDFDPRGQLIAVSATSDCSDPLLVAELDEPDDCEAIGRVKLGERTQLEPTDQAPEGSSAELFYQLLPDRNCTLAQGGGGKPLRKAKLSVRVKHADPGASYDVCVDEVDRGELATNAAGVGRADFTFTGGNGKGSGKGKGAPHRAAIDFDVYGSEFALRDDGDCSGDDATALFFGPLRAPLCSPEDLASATLVDPSVTPPPATPAGEASFERSSGCARELAVSVAGLAPSATYDVNLRLDASETNVEGVAALVTDASGNASVVFSSDPATGELPLAFEPAVGQVIEVLATGTTTVALSGTLE